MIANKVKLVVWDLDDTFWQGTLTEGGIAPIARNREIVLELSRRGIINSICSKNDYDEVKGRLGEMGIWDYFVFPHIRFGPKGQAIAEMLEGAGLRAENVLFIDDNPSNLEEVKFFNPGIMTAHPVDILDSLLDHPHCAGKPDPELTRLKQYQFLQRKVEERSTSALSNEEFLRASNIKVTIDYDLEENFDRIVELINRTNQLNYTKKRLDTPAEVERFRVLLNETFHSYAGCVRASDNYGDYGLVGFFLLRQNARAKKLIHFVFSCRTMNMGIEQYVYDMLGRPEIEIAAPVSYGLSSHAAIDWINSETEGQTAAAAGAGKLVLLGGCDLLQLASYCSTNRLEFVNRCDEDIKVRYEDPGFVLGDRQVIRESKILPKFPNWTHDDVVRFDEGVASAGLIILSMWPAMNGDYYRLSDGIQVRLNRKFAGRIRRRDPDWYSANFERLPLDEDNDRLPMIAEAFSAIGKRGPAECRIFVLGAYTLGEKPELRYRRENFNRFAREYCENNPDRFHFLDQDTIVPSSTLVDKKHYDRRGYFVLAQHILGLVGTAQPGTPDDVVVPASEAAVFGPRMREHETA
jgi:FkbH-like protein